MLFCRKKTTTTTAAKLEKDEKKNQGWWARFRRILTVAWWTMVIVETVVSIALELCAFAAPMAMADFEIPEYLAPFAPIINQTVAAATTINNNNPLLQYLVPNTTNQPEDRVTEPTQPKSFLEIAGNQGSSKVLATRQLEACRNNETGNPCAGNPFEPRAENPFCRVNGNYYDSMYQRWLGPWSTVDTPHFALVNLGLSVGSGIQVFREFLPTAQIHGLVSSCHHCDDDSPFLMSDDCNKPFTFYNQGSYIHCVEMRNLDQLQFIWRTQVRQTYGAPLKVVVDDGEHKSSKQMAHSIFFWFPRLAPGGMLFLENIEQNPEIRSQLLPQVMQDMHWCGASNSETTDKPCFPTIQPLLKSIHCELHICVLERNDVEAHAVSSLHLPANALNASLCNG